MQHPATSYWKKYEKSWKIAKGIAERTRRTQNSTNITSKNSTEQATINNYMSSNDSKNQLDTVAKMQCKRASIKTTTTELTWVDPVC